MLQGRTKQKSFGGRRRQFAIFKGFELKEQFITRELSAESVAKYWDKIDGENNMQEPQSGSTQSQKFAMQAAEKLGLI